MLFPVCLFFPEKHLLEGGSQTILKRALWMETLLPILILEFCDTRFPNVYCQHVIFLCKTRNSDISMTSFLLESRRDCVALYSSWCCLLVSRFGIKTRYWKKSNWMKILNVESIVTTHRSNVEIQVDLCIFPSHDFMSSILRRLSQETSMHQFSLLIRIRTQGSSGTGESSKGVLKEGTGQYHKSKSARGFIESLTPRDEEFRPDRSAIGVSRLTCPSCWSCARDGAEQGFLFLYFQRDFLGSTWSPKHILFQWCGGDGRAVAEIRVDRGCTEVRLWENWLWVALCSWIYVRRLFSLTTFPVLTLRGCEDVWRWLPFTK